MTIDYVKQRQAFGKKIIEFQNTQFVLAECKSEATVAKVFLDHCIERHVKGELDTVTASMAKYWLTDLLGKIVDRCLQLFGGYGYHGRVSDLAALSRCASDAHLRRHQRDHEADHRPQPVSFSASRRRPAFLARASAAAWIAARTR